jgi:hypothetical protein
MKETRLGEAKWLAVSQFVNQAKERERAAYAAYRIVAGETEI